MGVEDDQESMSEVSPPTSKSSSSSALMLSEGGIELNRRGIPARKRKKNSLIYGADDLVSIPIKSPKKRGPKAVLPTTTAAKDKRMSSIVAGRTSKSAPPTVINLKTDERLEIIDIERVRMGNGSNSLPIAS